MIIGAGILVGMETAGTGITGAGTVGTETGGMEIIGAGTTGGTEVAGVITTGMVGITVHTGVMVFTADTMEADSTEMVGITVGTEMDIMEVEEMYLITAVHVADMLTEILEAETQEDILLEEVEIP